MTQKKDLLAIIIQKIRRPDMKERNILVILLCITFLIFLGSFVNRNFNYEIKGNIRGLKNDSVIVFIRNYDKNGNVLSPDTIVAVAKNDKFFIKGSVPDIRDAYTILGGFRSRKNFSFFIEKGIIQIKGDIDSTDQVSITGTPNNNDYTAHKNIEDAIYGEVRLLQLKLKGNKNEEEVREISNRVDELRDSIKTLRLHFVETHPDSRASAIYLYVMQDNISIEKLESLYNSFSQQVKNSGFVSKIPEKINARKRSAIGKIAPEFTSTDTSGKSISLAAFRGKYVLLDFWASWCVPCREENPYLVQAYKKYKDKGFTIIGISMDNIGEKWKEAIQKDQLNWTHVSDLKAFENKVANLYGVQPIPDNFLIDPAGKIIARQLRGKEIEEKLSEVIK